MLVQITAERVRFLRCEECEWTMDMYEKGDDDEIDSAYTAEYEHHGECGQGRVAVIEWIDGVVTVWYEVVTTDDFAQVGPQIWMSVKRAGPLDRSYWRALMS